MSNQPIESKILPLFTRRTQEVGTLLPERYLHGLSTGDFDLALRGLLGECERLRDAFVRTYHKTDKKAVETLLRDWDRTT